MKMTNLFKVFQKVLLDIDQDDEVLSPPCYLCLPSAGAGGRGRGWPWQWCREVDWCSARAPPARSPGTRGPPPCSNMPAVNKENISKVHIVKISAKFPHISRSPHLISCPLWLLRSPSLISAMLTAPAPPPLNLLAGHPYLLLFRCLSMSHRREKA